MPELKFVDADEMVDRSDLPPFTISISGFPGCGKTSLALSMSLVMPVFVVETEMRMQYLLNRLHFKPKHPIKIVQLGNWNDIEAILSQLSSWRKQNDSEHAALIIDSATDYKNFANDEWQRTSKTFPPTNYAKLYRMMDKPIHDAKESGLSVIMTSRMKPHYANDAWDGESYRPDEFKNQRYITDAALEFDLQGNLFVAKNSWADIRTWQRHPVSRELMIADIIKNMMGNDPVTTTETDNE